MEGTRVGYGEGMPTPSEWNLVRLSAYAEGLTLLLLLGIAVPLKHVCGHPELVRIVGPVHGLAFLAYQYSLWRLWLSGGVTSRQMLRGALAAFWPFGTWHFSRSLERPDVSLG